MTSNESGRSVAQAATDTVVGEPSRTVTPHPETHPAGVPTVAATVAATWHTPVSRSLTMRLVATP